MKELRLALPSGSTHRSRVGCFGLCDESEGPFAVVYPDGIWYRSCTPEAIERILQEHVIGGEVVTENVFQRSRCGGCSRAPL